MPDLLLELYSEEIPSSMQRPAAESLKRQVTDALVAHGLTYEAAVPYWTPRRLTLDIRTLSARSRDAHEVRKGPATTAPQAAIAGFLRAAGLSGLDEAKIIKDPKKGAYYSAEITRKGRAAKDILAEILPEILRAFSWPKTMRWGAASAADGAPRWVRPLHSILCLLSTDTESELVPFSFGGIASSNVTYGHPFMHGRAPIHIRRFEDYAAKLDKAKVVLSAERRKQSILADARNLCFAKGLELVEDDRLAEEVAGLTEWPVPLLGAFEPRFLDIPAEIIRLTIKTNQKCFVTRPLPAAKSAAAQMEKAAHHGRSAQEQDSTAALANAFILTANIEAKDNGAEIIKGNGKVVAARLSDALYFWQADQKPLPDLEELRASAAKFGLDLAKPLDQRMARLDRLNVTFHAKLGAQGARVARIAALAAKIAPLTGAEPKQARRAAALAKADLQTETVGEFPELQGLIGRKYALLQGEPTEIAAAAEEHYKPLGPKDSLPRNPVSAAVALADKIDMLAGFWLIDERPTGSKDPYALRRAALGIIRLVLAQDAAIPLLPLFREAAQLLYPDIVAAHIRRFGGSSAEAEEKRFEEQLIAGAEAALRNLLSFFHERFKVWLRDEGAPHDVIEAALAENDDDLLQAARKIEALTHFLAGKDGAALLGGAKRALNILAAEEAKQSKHSGAADGKKASATAKSGHAAGKLGHAAADIAPDVDPVEFTAKQEIALYDAVFQTERALAALPPQKAGEQAPAILAELGAPIDAFFENVLVNDENPAIRANRLALLARLRRLLSRYADFSKLNG